MVADGCQTTGLSFSVRAVADRGEARLRRDHVVRPLSRVAARPCARPGCPAPATATLNYRYSSREVWLLGLAPERIPGAYDLCRPHAERTQPPQGWELVDQRDGEDDLAGSDEQASAPSSPRQRPSGARAPAPARDLGGEDTVAVLAAALHAVPDDDDRHEETPSVRDRGDEPSPLLEPDEEVSQAFAELRDVATPEGNADREATTTAREVAPVESVDDLEDLEATAEAILAALDALERRMAGRHTGRSASGDADGGGADQATLW